MTSGSGTPLELLLDTLERLDTLADPTKSRAHAAVTAELMLSRERIRRAVNDPMLREPPHCSTCSCGMPATHYAFLTQRPIDSQAWPNIYSNATLAEQCGHRCSPVIAVHLEVTDGINKNCGSCNPCKRELAKGSEEHF